MAVYWKLQQEKAHRKGYANHGSRGSQYPSKMGVQALHTRDRCEYQAKQDLNPLFILHEIHGETRDIAYVKSNDQQKIFELCEAEKDLPGLFPVFPEITWLVLGCCLVYCVDCFGWAGWCA